MRRSKKRKNRRARSHKTAIKKKRRSIVLKNRRVKRQTIAVSRKRKDNKPAAYANLAGRHNGPQHVNGFGEENNSFFPFLNTTHGKLICEDSLDVLRTFGDGSVDLFMTSPPFGLVRKKDYGNVEADDYVEWFKPFATEMFRCLKDSGSLVIDIGGAWNKGFPTP